MTVNYQNIIGTFVGRDFLAQSSQGGSDGNVRPTWYAYTEGGKFTEMPIPGGPSFTEHNYADLAWDPDKRFLVTANGPGISPACYVFERSGSVLTKLASNPPTGGSRSYVKWCPDGSLFMSAGPSSPNVSGLRNNGDSTFLQMQSPLTLQPGNVTGIEFNPDGNVFYTIEANGPAYIKTFVRYRTCVSSSGTFTDQFQYVAGTVDTQPPGVPRAIAASPDGAYLAVYTDGTGGGTGQGVDVYTVSGPYLTHLTKLTIAGTASTTPHLVFSPDSAFLYGSLNTSGTLFGWEVAAGTFNALSSMPTGIDPTVTLSISGNGRYLAVAGTAGGNSSVYTVNTATGALTFKENLPNNLEGRASAFSNLTLVEEPTYSYLLATVAGHTSSGRRLYSISNDSTDVPIFKMSANPIVQSASTVAESSSWHPQDLYYAQAMSTLGDKIDIHKLDLSGDEPELVRLTAGVPTWSTFKTYAAWNPSGTVLVGGGEVATRLEAAERSGDTFTMISPDPFSTQPVINQMMGAFITDSLFISGGESASGKSIYLYEDYTEVTSTNVDTQPTGTVVRNGLVVSPDGNYVAISGRNITTNNCYVDIYAVSGNSLTRIHADLLSGFTPKTAQSRVGLAFSNDSKFLYWSCGSTFDRSVVGWSVDGGAFNLIDTTNIVFDSTSVGSALTIDPTNTWLVAGSLVSGATNEAHVMKIDPVTGELTAMGKIPGTAQAAFSKFSNTLVLN